MPLVRKSPHLKRLNLTATRLTANSTISFVSYLLLDTNHAITIDLKLQNIKRGPVPSKDPYAKFKSDLSEAAKNSQVVLKF
jgi:hypothetical protein